MPRSVELPAKLLARWRALSIDPEVSGLTYTAIQLGEDSTALAADLTRLSEHAHRAPQGLLHVSTRYARDTLRERLSLLDELIAWYTPRSPRERDAAAALIERELGIADAPASLAVWRMAHRVAGHRVLEGAENATFVTPGTHVVKITKDRHHHDFYSVLKLMRHMHVLYLEVHRGPDADPIDVRVSGEEMFLLRGPSGFVRVIVQPFEPDPAPRALPPEVRADAGWRRAWRGFLDRMVDLVPTQRMTLDLTDSSAGFRRARGNVANTENVFVEVPPTPDGPWRFTVIDPDVFDLDGTHKFSPLEYARPSVRRRLGWFTAALTRLKIWGVNVARSRFVVPWQQAFVDAERDHARESIR